MRMRSDLALNPLGVELTALPQTPLAKLTEGRQTSQGDGVNSLPLGRSLMTGVTVQ